MQKKFYALLLVLVFLINGIAFAKPSKKEIKPMKKIVQTAGRTQFRRICTRICTF